MSVLKKNYFISIISLLSLTFFLFLIFDSRILKKRKEDGESLTCFLTNVMIRENGIYTLLGSKPMTTFNIDSGALPYSKEDMLSLYENIISENPTLKGNLSFSDYQKTVSEALEKKYLKHEELWHSWMKEYGTKRNKRFVFCSIKSPYGDRSEGLFINIPVTTYILSKYQDLIQKRIGFSFDPYTVLNEVSSENSVFWEKIFKDHVIMGILLGYGERNAFIWELEDNLNESLQCKPINATINDSEYSKILVKEEVTIDDLLIPLFVSFSQYDPEIERYQQERKFIMSKISKKRFCSQIIDLLGYESD